MITLPSLYAQGGGGGGGGGGGSDPSPNVQDYKATLGTDTTAGRTLRLLAGARLNGHYRVGPGVDADRAYGSDTGTTSSSSSDDSGGIRSSSTTYSVTTSQDGDQVAGLEPDTGDGINPTDKVLVDSKNTEVPYFVAPYSEDDCVAYTFESNSSTPRVDDDGEPVLNRDGDQIIDPPAPVQLEPGGYQSVEVPPGQTLELTAGVYFFKDELKVNGGKIIVRGDGPSIVFCGEKATFVDARINPDRSTSQLQLCFTDDLEDEAVLNDVTDSVSDIFAGSAGDADNWKNMIAPPKTGGGREGFSVLESRGGTEIRGSISGRALVADMQGSELFGSIMANVVRADNSKVHQDLALKGSNLMAAGGWALESVHQVR